MGRPSCIGILRLTEETLSIAKNNNPIETIFTSMFCIMFLFNPYCCLKLQSHSFSIFTIFYYNLKSKRATG